jgi:hypothetical protein
VAAAERKRVSMMWSEDGRRRFTFFFADFPGFSARLCCVLIRRICSLFLGGDTRFTRPAAVLLFRRPGRAVLTGGGSTMGATATASVGGSALVFGTGGDGGTVGWSGLTGTNLGSI